MDKKGNLVFLPATNKLWVAPKERIVLYLALNISNLNPHSGVNSMLNRARNTKSEKMSKKF